MKLKKISIALVLALMLLVQNFGSFVFAAAPEEGINLVYDSTTGKIRDGVYITHSRVQYKKYIIHNAFDDNASTLCKMSSANGDDGYGWIQINLPCPMDLSSIYYKGRNVATDRSFKIEVSNDKTFSSEVVEVVNLAESKPSAALDKAYSTNLTGTDKYQYIRWTKTAGSGTEIATLHVYGTWEEPQQIDGRTELQMGTDVIASANDNHTDAVNLLDNDTSTVWRVDKSDNDSEPYVQIDLNKQCFIDEIALTPIEKLTSNFSTDFEILLSNDENFTNSTKVFSQIIKGATPSTEAASSVTAYTNDIKNTYRYIRIAKLPASKSGRTVSEVSGYTSSIGFSDVKIFGKVKCEVASTVPANGQTDVTNIENRDPFVTINFAVDVEQKTLNKENIIIKKTADNSVVTEYTAETESKKYKIPLDALESDTEYTVTVSNAVASNEYGAIEEKSFTFTTGTVLDIPYAEGKIIKNVAKGKTLDVFSGTSDNAITVKNADALLDGSYADGSNEAFQINGVSNNLNNNATDINSNGYLFKIDLGNYYDIKGVRLVTREDDSSSKWDSANLAIGGSVSDSKLEKGITYFKTDATTGIGHTTTGTLPSDYGSAKYGNGKCTFIPSSDIRHRYIYGMKTTQRVYLAELEVYAQVSEDFGSWNEPSVDGNVYTFSIPTESYIEGKTYFIVAAGYDENGYITGNIVAESKQISDGKLIVSIAKTDDTKKIKVVVLNGIGNAMLTDAFEYTVSNVTPSI